MTFAYTLWCGVLQISKTNTYLLYIVIRHFNLLAIFSSFFLLRRVKFLWFIVLVLWSNDVYKDLQRRYINVLRMVLRSLIARCGSITEFSYGVGSLHTRTYYSGIFFWCFVAKLYTVLKAGGEQINRFGNMF